MPSKEFTRVWLSPHGRRLPQSPALPVHHVPQHRIPDLEQPTRGAHSQSGIVIHEAFCEGLGHQAVAVLLRGAGGRRAHARRQAREIFPPHLPQRQGRAVAEAEDGISLHPMRHQGLWHFKQRGAQGFGRKRGLPGHQRLALPVLIAAREMGEEPEGLRAEGGRHGLRFNFLAAIYLLHFVIPAKAGETTKRE